MVYEYKTFRKQVKNQVKNAFKAILDKKESPLTGPKKDKVICVWVMREIYEELLTDLEFHTRKGGNRYENADYNKYGALNVDYFKNEFYIKKVMLILVQFYNGLLDYKYEEQMTMTYHYDVIDVDIVEKAMEKALRKM